MDYIRDLEIPTVKSSCVISGLMPSEINNTAAVAKSGNQEVQQSMHVIQSTHTMVNASPANLGKVQ